MKRLLTILFLLYSLTSQATNYYFATAGNDAGAGTLASPWKTITKVNSWFANLNPGDQILFNRGDTFTGTITISKSGTSGHVITIGAYGTGADPIITGFTTLTGWTNAGDGTYYKTITADAQTNMVTVNGVNTGMGRYPDATYLTYGSPLSKASPCYITYSGVSSGTTNWTGAQLVLRANDYSLLRTVVSSHSGTAIYFGGSSIDMNNSGSCFIQNDIRCVTTTNEWYHNASTGKFSIYGDPAAKTVKVATLNYLIKDVSGYDYITVDGIDFQGAIISPVWFGNTCNYITIQNCNVNFSGNDGIYLGDNGNYYTIDNNTISNSSNSGIYVLGFTAAHGVVTNNTIKYSGQIKGSCANGVNSTGISIQQTNYLLIQYNDVDYSGYNGIFSRNTLDSGLPIEIRNNLVNHSGAGTGLNDGGGIYVNGYMTINAIIDGNIVRNSLGRGIYLDDEANHVTVTNNTVEGCAFAGIQFHRTYNVTFTGNTLYNNAKALWVQNSGTAGTMHNNILTNNIFFAKTATQTISYYLTQFSPLSDTKVMTNPDYNYYARPTDKTGVLIQLHSNSEGDLNETYLGWRTYSGQDVHSTLNSLVNTDTTKSDFYINPSKSNATISVTNMIDVKGTKYPTSITLLPYTSAVLLPDPNPIDPPSIVPVFSVTLSGTNIITTAGGNTQLSAAILPANATDQRIVWSITNGTGQGTISTLGRVIAIADGTVTAKATAQDGSGVFGTRVITISGQVVTPTQNYIIIVGTSAMKNGTILIKHTTP